MVELYNKGLIHITIHNVIPYTAISFSVIAFTAVPFSAIPFTKSNIQYHTQYTRLYVPFAQEKRLSCIGRSSCWIAIALEEGKHSIGGGAYMVQGVAIPHRDLSYCIRKISPCNELSSHTENHEVLR